MNKRSEWKTQALSAHKLALTKSRSAVSIDARPVPPQFSTGKHAIERNAMLHDEADQTPLLLSYPLTEQHAKQLAIKCERQYIEKSQWMQIHNLTGATAYLAIRDSLTQEWLFAHITFSSTPIIRAKV